MTQTLFFILAVVTGYSPSVVALTDMLRTQLSITQSLVAHTRQLAATVSSSITPNYHYTTLEETKQVIIDYTRIKLQLIVHCISTRNYANPSNQASLRNRTAKHYKQISKLVLSSFVWVLWIKVPTIYFIQYIARHRPKLLSFEEARKLVQSEHQ